MKESQGVRVDLHRRSAQGECELGLDRLGQVSFTLTNDVSLQP